MRLTIELNDKEHVDVKIFAAKNKTGMGKLGRDALLGLVYGGATTPERASRATHDPSEAEVS